MSGDNLITALTGLSDRF